MIIGPSTSRLRLQPHRNSGAGLVTLALLILSPGFCVPSAAAKEEVDSERAVRSIARARWYDEEQQSYVPPKIVPQHDNSIRSDGRKAAVAPAATKNNWNWGNWPQFFSQLFSWVVVGLLGTILLIAIVMLCMHAFRNYVPGRLGDLKKKESIKIDPSRVVDLPFDVLPTSNDPLTEADRLRLAGRYDEAIVYLYGYMLLALDQSRKIHLQQGKTNRMYLRELKLANLERILEFCMLSFESVFFGKHSLSKETFELAWNQLGRFHDLLQVEQHKPQKQTGAEASPA